MPSLESSGMRRSRKKSQSRAKMILLLVIIFLVCFFPHHLFMIWFYYHPLSKSLYNDFWHVLRIFAFCLTFLNSTLNPITLYLTSEQFKTLFNRYLWGCFFRSISLPPADVSDCSTVPAESPPPHEQPLMASPLAAADKNQNQDQPQKGAGKVAFDQQQQQHQQQQQTSRNPATVQKPDSGRRSKRFFRWKIDAIFDF